MKHQLTSLALLCCAPFLSCFAEQAMVTTDTLRTGDSLLVITTACAPVCSSVVQVFTADGRLVGTLPSPFPKAIFPEAYIQDGKLRWRDNTEAILDENEKH